MLDQESLSRPFANSRNGLIHFSKLPHIDPHASFMTNSNFEGSAQNCSNVIQTKHGCNTALLSAVRLPHTWKGCLSIKSLTQNNIAKGAS